jgi:hypothetical protein
MKQFQSTTETVWTEKLKVELTEAEKQLMRSENEEDKADKDALFERIRLEEEKVATQEETTSLNSFYNTTKPTLKQNDTYELISCDCSEVVPNVYKGILNCRVNGEHKQIRF